MEIDKIKRDVFELDWSLVRLLIELREMDAPAETVDKILALLRDLNRR